MIVRLTGSVLRITGRTHRDEQVVGDAARRADVDVQKLVSSRAGGWRRVFGDRHLEQVAQRSTAVASFPPAMTWVS